MAEVVERGAELQREGCEDCRVCHEKIQQAIGVGSIQKYLARSVVRIKTGCQRKAVAVMFEAGRDGPPTARKAVAHWRGFDRFGSGPYVHFVGLPVGGR